VDVHGGLNLKKIFGSRALAVFVKAPSIQHLENRLKLRETETAESIARRINKAGEEMELASQFDEIVLNDQMEHAFSQAEEIVNKFLESK
jgi:guanylate kinase